MTDLEAPASKIDVILAEVARHGTANVRRAYGNWKIPHLKQWEDNQPGRADPGQAQDLIAAALPAGPR